MFRIAILISGTGSNMASLLQYEAAHPDCPYHVRQVIADRPAQGLATAEAFGVPARLIDRKAPDFPARLMDALAGVDGIVLAGFLSILPGEIIQAFSGRIINIHPSLLPKYGGRGMYGLKVHARVLAEGDQVSGCTCHLVTEEVDGGEILLAKAVPVLKTDTPETLQARILPFEHEVIVQGLLKLIAKLEGGDTIKNEGAMENESTMQNKSTMQYEGTMEHESTMKKEGTMKNALISVFDKTKVVELAEFLIARDWNIISSGGTYQYLKDNGIAVKKVEDVTGFAEMLDGRVKTLHPRIHGGLLALRDNEAHMAALKDNSIEAIDLVCVNLYPFAAKVAENLSFSELIEFIDIGGPSMLRSAAKNFKDVLVLSEVTQYQEFMAKYDTAALDMDYRKKLAGAVFTMTSRYDAQIAEYLQESVGVDGIGAPEDLGIDLASDKLILNLSKVKDLKYGENPHQKAAFYRIDGLDGFMTDFEQLNGKDMGYINYKDLESAWRIVCDFDEIACAAVKHNTPCGVALGESALEAYAKAYRCDPVSIFGGIVAVNREVDEACAAEMSKIMLHIVAAPGFTPEALAILKGKRNLIIIKMNQHPSGNKTMVSADGGVLIQDDDLELFDELQFVTEKVPDAAELEELKFALQVVKFVKSNGIVVSRDRMALGIGGGFVNRIDAAAYALNRGEKPLVMASDAFFPFDDVVALAGEKGIKAIIQPGGSLHDQLSIDRCNELGIAMVLTGIRHFRH